MGCAIICLPPFTCRPNARYILPRQWIWICGNMTATQENISKLQSFGNILIPPGNGELASGLHGEGRMAEPEEIIAFISADIKKKLPLANQKILVTAGPTYEAIDPVRFIGNHSSGKMGFAIADELALLGADVTLGSRAISTSKQTTIN